MTRLLKNLALLPLILIILLEEWLWDPLKRVMDRLARAPWIARLAAAVAALPPFAALAVYLVPVLCLLPFKLLGLWLMAQHRIVLGVFTFLAAKLLGTALLAWLFGLTRPALLQIGWFRWCYERIRRLSEAAHAWLVQHPVWRRTRRILSAWGARLRPSRRA